MSYDNEKLQTPPWYDSSVVSCEIDYDPAIDDLCDPEDESTGLALTKELERYLVVAFPEAVVSVVHNSAGKLIVKGRFSGHGTTEGASDEVRSVMDHWVTEKQKTTKKPTFTIDEVINVIHGYKTGVAENYDPAHHKEAAAVCKACDRIVAAIRAAQTK